MEVDALYGKKGGKDGKGKGKGGKDKKDKPKGGKDGKWKGGKEPKGKSKGKPDKKEGIKCWICNGNHYAKDCKQRKVNMVDGTGGSASSGGAGSSPPGLTQTNVLEASCGNVSIFGITCCEEVELAETNHLLIDSGCETHMIGRQLLQGCAVTGEGGRLCIRSAGGHVLKHYGQSRMEFKTLDADAPTPKIEATFEVTDITRGILSIAALTDKGYTVSFEPGGSGRIFRPEAEGWRLPLAL
jgi:hypothetical protein